jgi:hypothetical protein
VCILSSVSSAQDPDYTLRFSDSAGASSGSTVTIGCLLDIAPGAEAIQGWSFGVCHDYTEVQPIAVESGATTATVQNGAPADFIGINFYPGDASFAGGVQHGAVIDIFDDVRLPSGSDYELLSISYDLVGADGTFAAIAYCDDSELPGIPFPTETLVVVDGYSVYPVLIGETIPIFSREFIRGDGNNDGSMDIADVVAMLAQIFGSAPQADCLDAMDANDSGQLDIADPVYLLNYLFGVGPIPPPSPYPDCGEDPTTSDALLCSSACP